MSSVLAALAAPFAPDAVSWRAGAINKDGTKAKAFAYIDARDVQNRLDEVMGWDWADEIVVQPSGLVTCRIGLWIEEQWRWRMDGTAAVREVDGKLDPKQEQAREMDQKGAVSDAFKRTAVKWGIGRYLYSIDGPWVAIDQYRQIDKAELPKLAGLLARSYRAPRPVEQESQPRQEAAQPIDPASDPMDDVLREARADPEWMRIEALLERNPRTRGDVTRIINAPANLESIKKWPADWQDAMRRIVSSTYDRVSPDETANSRAA